MDAPDDLHGAARQRGTSESAVSDLFEGFAAGLQSLAAVGAVGGDDSVERGFEEDVGHAVDHLVGHVGRNLEHDGPVLVLSAAEVEQGFEDAENLLPGMGRSVAAGVVAADVYGEVVRILVEVAEEFEIVRGGVFCGCGGIFPDVAADDYAVMGFAQVADRCFESAVCESDAVDDGAVPGESEDAGAGVSRLGLRGDGSDLHESEAHCGQFPKSLAVAVESGCDAHGIGETDAENLAFEGGVLHGVAFVQQPAAPGDQSDDTQQEDDGPVCPLDGEREEQGLYDLTVHIRAQR